MNTYRNQEVKLLKNDNLEDWGENGTIPWKIDVREIWAELAQAYVQFGLSYWE